MRVKIDIPIYKIDRIIKIEFYFLTSTNYFYF